MKRCLARSCDGSLALLLFHIGGIYTHTHTFFFFIESWLIHDAPCLSLSKAKQHASQRAKMKVV